MFRILGALVPSYCKKYIGGGLSELKRVFHFLDGSLLSILSSLDLTKMLLKTLRAYSPIEVKSASIRCFLDETRRSCSPPVLKFLFRVFVRHSGDTGEDAFHQAGVTDREAVFRLSCSEYSSERCDYSFEASCDCFRDSSFSLPNSSKS